MIHLFDKVYLSLDDFIQTDIDRVVIGRYGNIMDEYLKKIQKGILLNHYKTLPDNFSELIIQIKNYVDTLNKKFIIYADKDNFNKFLINWLKTIFVNLDLNTFNKILQLTILKERIINNTQLKPIHVLNMEQLWEGLGNLNNLFNEITISNEQRNSIKNLNLNLSYEFLLANYFSGSSNHINKLNTTVHKFLRRWFKEAFTDNREMILMNLLNKNFQLTLNFTENDLDLNSNNPIKNVSSLQYYADETIWEQKDDYGKGVYGICKIENLSQEKITGLRNLIKKIYNDVEGMAINKTMFSTFDYLELAVKDNITNDEMNTMLNFVVENPFDTCLVPKFDFQNINYVLIQHIFNLKRNNNIEALSKYQLI
jgi:hypothetical protein